MTDDKESKPQLLIPINKLLDHITQRKRYWGRPGGQSVQQQTMGLYAVDELKILEKLLREMDA